jgi:hypothetical protein
VRLLRNRPISRSAEVCWNLTGESAQAHWPAITLAWLHAMMPRIQRGASVFVPYLTPYPKQAAYMAGKASFEQPEVGEEQDAS